MAQPRRPEGGNTNPILEEPYRWNSWAAPKNISDQLDHNAALAGDDLCYIIDVKDGLLLRTKTENMSLRCTLMVKSTWTLHVNVSA